MSIVNKYTVESINKYETYDWLLNKHYLKRIPLNKNLKMNIYLYPKGRNEKYDASYKPQTQTKLF